MWRRYNYQGRSRPWIKQAHCRDIQLPTTSKQSELVVGVLGSVNRYGHLKATQLNILTPCSLFAMGLGQRISQSCLYPLAFLRLLGQESDISLLIAARKFLFIAAALVFIFDSCGWELLSRLHFIQKSVQSFCLLCLLLKEKSHQRHKMLILVNAN